FRDHGAVPRLTAAHLRSCANEAAHAAASSFSRRPHQQGRHQQRHPREVCASSVKTADPANANAIARVSVTLRLSFYPLVAAARCPACSSRNVLILLARRFGSTSTIAGMGVSAEIDRPPGQHCRVGHARLGASRPAKKREAPAVVGPGLSCADVSPRFWQIVMPARYRDRRAFDNSLESERTLV